MRHRKSGTQLSRNSSHRRAMLRNMVTSLLKYEQIETTHAKAKAIRPIAEKMITLAKRGDLNSRRLALSYLQDKAVAHKLFDELKERYPDRQGGYLRIVKKGVRKGDGAPVSIVQLIPVEDEKPETKKRSKKAKAPKKAPVQKKEKAEAKSAEKKQKSAEAAQEKEPESSDKDSEIKSDESQDEKDDSGEDGEK